MSYHEIFNTVFVQTFVWQTPQDHFFSVPISTSILIVLIGKSVAKAPTPRRERGSQGTSKPNLPTATSQWHHNEITMKSQWHQNILNYIHSNSIPKLSNFTHLSNTRKTWNNPPMAVETPQEENVNFNNYISFKPEREWLNTSQPIINNTLWPY